MSLVLPPQPRGDLDGVAFRQARNYTRAERKRGDVLWIVVHSAETSELKNAAENLAWWAAGPQAPRASWHFAVDSNSVTQSVLEKDVAWHAPGANARGIGIEHAGRAKQTAEDWDDFFSTAMLIRSAELVVGICQRWGIPVQRLTVQDLKHGVPGICGHVDVSHAFGKSTHTDPGRFFLWDRFLDEIHRIVQEEQTLPPPENT